MLRSFLAGCLILLLGSYLSAQVITTDPVFPTANDEVTIFFDATQGTAGLEDCNCDVYLHTGLITSASTSPSDWKYVQTSWGVANPAWRLEPVAGQPNVYSYTISPNIREYYGVPANETIEKMAFVFRNANGSLEGKDDGGSDIFYEVFPESAPFSAVLVTPGTQAVIASLGETIPVEVAANETSDFTLSINGNVESTQIGNSLNYDIEVNELGTKTVSVEVVSQESGESKTLSFVYVVPLDDNIANPPADSRNGITFTSDESVHLQLFAPNKGFVFVIGDFNDYQLSTDYQMTKSSDGDTFWIEIDGLAPGENYTFQYLVDGEITIADPYSTLILDPFHDQWIPEATYSDLPEYPNGKATGIVSLITPGAPEFDWTDEDYVRPEKKDLIVYELLMRDFLEGHDYTSLIDTLDYLERLGVNVIEFMPINEFEGNQSWGYNPSFHMALDKYYGPVDEFKRFVNECHERGIAVVLDVVFNHAFSQSPLCQLYWDAAAFKPRPDNPWLNPDARHPFNVGYDFNHESQATRDFTKQVVQYWIEEFHVDGFRFDLSKGFTQVNTGVDVGAWSAYDASRIAIWKEYADFIWGVDDECYIILEHFAVNQEEKELAEYGQGMLIWGNNNHTFNQASMGYDGSNFADAFHANGSNVWSLPGVMAYMESHDEERLMYKNIEYGNNNSDYDVRELTTALQRQELVTTFFYAIPGPKMLWQFGELGYDYSINTCVNGTVNDNCRLDPKPIRWDYYDEPNRRRLYEVTRAMMDLRKNLEVFSTNVVNLNVAPTNYKTIQMNHSSMSLAIQGNFSVLPQSVPNPFQMTGWWYEYFTGDSLLVTNTALPLQLAPGEYRLYTTERLDGPPGGFITSSYEVVNDDFGLQLVPNPATDWVRVDYHLPIAAQVQTEVFSADGQLIVRLESERKPAGNHQIELRASLPSGMYWVKLTVDRKVEVQKLIISK